MQDLVTKAFQIVADTLSSVSKIPYQLDSKEVSQSEQESESDDNETNLVSQKIQELQSSNLVIQKMKKRFTKIDKKSQKIKTIIQK
jgi:hypothetical protein